MAIDSAAKRASVAGFIIPDGELGRGDRATVAGYYGSSGIEDISLLSLLLNLFDPSPGGQLSGRRFRKKFRGAR